MQTCAETAHRYWAKCGTWVNIERALYLLALVANAQAEYENAVEHARTALQAIVDNGKEPIDEAFIRLAAAQAYWQLNLIEEHQQELDQADELAAQWDDEDLKTEYSVDRGKVIAATAVA
jgi:tetratricopeptide (TPR) repeat protein